MKRTIKDFSRKQIKRIAEDYARTENMKSGAHYCELCDVSESTFHNILKKAIVESVVSEETGRRIARKSAENTSRHGGKPAYIRTMNAYEKYFEQRKSFEFPRDKKIFYATEYANSSMNSLEFRMEHCIEKRLFDNTLESAIVQGLVNDDIVNILEQKAIEFNDSCSTRTLYRTLREKRQKYENLPSNMKKAKPKSGGKQSISSKRSKKNSELMKMRHREFVQTEMEYYGIPDEMDDYRRSIDDFN